MGGVAHGHSDHVYIEIDQFEFLLKKGLTILKDSSTTNYQYPTFFEYNYDL